MAAKGARTQIWVSFSSVAVVEETAEMPQHLPYTEYIQFYPSISPTYNFKLFQV